MADSGTASPQQIALGRALVALKGMIDGLDDYYAVNVNNMDDPKPLRKTIDALDAARDDLALTAIVIGLDAQQKDFDDLSAVSQELKAQLDTIDKNLAAAKQVVAMATAGLALVNAITPAFDAAALQAAIKDAGAALKPAT